MLSASLLFASVEIKPGWNLIAVDMHMNAEYDLETLLSGKATIAWKFNTSDFISSVYTDYSFVYYITCSSSIYFGRFDM